MLKLDQIEILAQNELIVEVMEPTIYNKVGTVIKSDDTISREKANVYYTVVTVVKIHKPFTLPAVVGTNTGDPSATRIERVLKIGDNLIVPRNQITPIQFPVEGYDSPRLGVINTYTPFAIIREDI